MLSDQDVGSSFQSVWDAEHLILVAAGASLCSLRGQDWCRAACAGVLSACAAQTMR